MNHEEELIKAFFTPTKRQRYLEFVTKPKTREKFLRELAHFKSLDPRYARAVHVNPAEDALGELGRDMGTFLSFVPGRLAYFENEDGHWILEHPLGRPMITGH